MATKLFTDAAFDPETINAMVTAFRLACKAMPMEAKTAKPLLARRIIKAARTGERDADQLCAMAVKSMKCAGASLSTQVFARQRWGRLFGATSGRHSFLDN